MKMTNKYLMFASAALLLASCDLDKFPEGQYVSGEQKEDSDIDICIKLQEPDYFTRMEIKEFLEKLFNAKVDVVSLTAIMRSLFRNHIEKDAIYI